MVKHLKHLTVEDCEIGFLDWKGAESSANYSVMLLPVLHLSPLSLCHPDAAEESKAEDAAPGDAAGDSGEAKSD